MSRRWKWHLKRALRDVRAARAHAPGDGPAILAELMRRDGLGPDDLATRVSIDAATLAAVLAGERVLTEEQRAVLGVYFGIAPDVFLPSWR